MLAPCTPIGAETGSKTLGSLESSATETEPGCSEGDPQSQPNYLKQKPLQHLFSRGGTCPPCHLPPPSALRGTRISGLRVRAVPFRPRRLPSRPGPRALRTASSSKLVLEEPSGSGGRGGAGGFSAPRRSSNMGCC